ncbi:MAG: cytochrome c oxidase assembly protein [Bacillota bacterium]|uniref:cytochrome c oxidase assembly protein n=1 Tax=Fictibacillus TaxID=1329200 RepID=UPI0018CEDA75|nr:cytochrome c oxidase assembly protein [Fictibacillus sp. 5RED26]MBH0159483.1 cytochrome c oxidase assembly protein [Fictibacillus sp. 26RED30]MBH0163718.1 cytochrome c oxidase assembly protein [Fictibacillus sp. 7GRE50]MBH0169656.1 cytochrome c oxidase assembly protein [Fictibacillus sp. 18YEL24]MBH0174156.1 cytochrome c oxidase assembly protein [Fictibacillus sp. 23RED33]
MNNVLTTYPFFELWKIDILLLIVFLGFIFSLVTKRVLILNPHLDGVSIKKRALFCSGLILWAIAEGSPLSLIGHHYLFSVHMVQMTITYLMVPPLLIAGLPEWVFTYLFQVSSIKKMVHFATRPLLAILVFNSLFSIYHFPNVFDTLMANPWAMDFYHIVLFITSIMMWFPIISNVQTGKELSSLQKTGYIFAMGVLLTPACALIIFAKDILYQMYQHRSSITYLSYTPLYDQQLGGVIMKIGQEIIYGTVLLRIFIGWFKKDKLYSIDELPAEDYRVPKG